MIGEKQLERIDRIFSRKVLGSVFIGGTAGKVVEKIIEILALMTNQQPVPDTLWTALALWFVGFVIAVLVSIYWERLERQKDELVEDAQERLFED